MDKRFASFWRRRSMPIIPDELLNRVVIIFDISLRMRFPAMHIDRRYSLVWMVKVKRRSWPPTRRPRLPRRSSSFKRRTDVRLVKLVIRSRSLSFVVRLSNRASWVKAQRTLIQRSISKWLSCYLLSYFSIFFFYFPTGCLIFSTLFTIKSFSNHSWMKSCFDGC